MNQRDDDRSIPRAATDQGAVSRIGPSAVGLSRDEPFAVSARCRHQLADLSKGTVDADGCLVCPWHGARYDVGTGTMVKGPQGFLGLHRKTPRYAALVRAYARLLPLRRRGVTVRDDRIELDDR